jgi:hypothetical protein
MWLWVIKVATVSIILIVLLHYLYTFFKMTLTVPKIKDLVYRPNQKYEDLFNTINNGPNLGNTSINSISQLPTSSTTPINAAASSTAAASMKDELKNYLKNLSLNKNNGLGGAAGGEGGGGSGTNVIKFERGMGGDSGGLTGMSLYQEGLGNGSIENNMMMGGDMGGMKYTPYL